MVKNYLWRKQVHHALRAWVRHFCASSGEPHLRSRFGSLARRQGLLRVHLPSREPLRLKQSSSARILLASTLNTVALMNTKFTMSFVAPVGLAKAANDASEPSPTSTYVCGSSRTPESLMDVSVQKVTGEEMRCHGPGDGKGTRKVVSAVPTKSCTGVALSSAAEQEMEILRLHLHRPSYAFETLVIVHRVIHSHSR